MRRGQKQKERIAESEEKGLYRGEGRTWGGSIPGSVDRMCKGPEVGQSWTHLSNENIA